MILRLTFLALMALGLLGFGTVLWVATRTPEAEAASATALAKVAVLTAAKPVNPGVLVKPDDIGSIELPADKAGTDATTDTPEGRRAMIGAMVRNRMSPGDVIRDRDIMRTGDHGFLAAVLQPGMVAVSVGVDAVSGTAGLIWPGDRIDVILTQTIQDVNRPVGRRIAAETVLTAVRVIAIDQQIVQGAAPEANDAAKSRTVTLEVSRQGAERVSVASRIGHLSLSVRAADPAAARDWAWPWKQSTTTTWAGDISPALDVPPPPPPPAPKPRPTLTVYPGTGDRKEFQF